MKTVFSGIAISSTANLSGRRFIECEFFDCDLSTANLNQASFQEAHFKDCKMLGLRFDHCNPFGFIVHFENCQLSHASFYQVKLAKTAFANSKLHEVDFTESDLSGANFDHCDLLNATFDHTILEKADFRTSFNYSIDPETNRIKGAKFSLPSVIGLLNKYGIKIDHASF